MALLVSSKHCGCGCFCDITDRCCYCIGESAIQNIGFGDSVGCSCLNFLTRGCIEAALCKGNAFDLGQGDCPLGIVDVCSRDIEGDTITKFICTRCALRHDHVISNRIWIIRIGTVGDRQGAFCFCDGIVVCLCAFIQLVGEGILALAYQRLAAGHIIGCAFTFNKAVAVDCNFVICQGCTVVDLGVCCRGQGDGALADLQRAVHYHELYFFEVHIFVCEVTCLQLHRVAAGICAIHGRVAAEGEVCLFVQRVADFHGVARDSLFCSVVLFRSAVFLDGYGDLIGQLGNRQGAFGLRNIVVGCLCAFIQLVGEGILALAYQRLAAGHIIGCAFTFNKAVAVDCNFVICQGCTVVDLGVCCRGQGDGALADLQRAVHYHELYFFEVHIFVCEVTCLQLHRVAAGICAIHGRVAAEGEVCLFVQRVADFHGVARDSLFCSVVLFRSAVFLDGYGDLIGQLGNRQGAFYCCDVIVGCLCAFIQLVGEGICAAADFRLAAGHIIGCAFAFNKAVAVDCDFVICQSGTVVDLAVGCRGEGYVALIDNQGACCGADSIVCGDIFSCCICY